MLRFFLCSYTIDLIGLLVKFCPPFYTFSQNRHIFQILLQSTCWYTHWFLIFLPVMFEGSTVKLLTRPTGNNSSTGIKLLFPFLSFALPSQAAKDLCLSRHSCHADKTVITFSSLLESSRNQKNTLLISSLLSCPVIFCIANPAANITREKAHNKNEVFLK